MLYVPHTVNSMNATISPILRTAFSFFILHTTHDPRIHIAIHTTYSRLILYSQAVLLTLYFVYEIATASARAAAFGP
jgi:hypothetical protein